MLEFFRRHRGAFLMTLTVIIILSFSVWGGWRKTHGGGAIADGSAPALSIYGKEYSIGEMQRLERYGQVMYMLQLYDVAQGLMQIASQPDTRGQDFVFNLLVLKHEMEAMGILPSDAEAKAALEALPALQDGGKFSLQRAHMMEENLGMFGFDTAGMLDVMKLEIGFNKLQEILAKNYQPSPLEIEMAYASRNQTAKISMVNFSAADFKKSVQVSDEDIKKYFEEKKDGYKSEEKRAVSYVLFALPADLESKPQEERTKLQAPVIERVNNFNDKTQDSKRTLEEIAKELKETVLTVPAFAQETPPEALKDEDAVLTAIFRASKSVAGVSDPVKGAKGYYIFHLTQIEEPKQQELAAVKDKIKDVLVTQKAQEAMSKAVNDARSALLDGLKAGKKIEDIAKEKGLTLSPQSELTVSAPPEGLANAQAITVAAAETAAGQVSKAVNSDDGNGVTLVYVAAKELRKREDSVVLRKSMEDSSARMQRILIFSAWFSKKRDEAKAKLLIKLTA